MFGKKQKLIGFAFGLAVACVAVASAPVNTFVFCACAGSLLACGVILAEMR